MAAMIITAMSRGADELECYLNPRKSSKTHTRNRDNRDDEPSKARHDLRDMRSSKKCPHRCLEGREGRFQLGEESCECGTKLFESTSEGLDA